MCDLSAGGVHPRRLITYSCWRTAAAGVKFPRPAAHYQYLSLIDARGIGIVALSGRRENRLPAASTIGYSGTFSRVSAPRCRRLKTASGRQFLIHVMLLDVVHYNLRRVCVFFPLILKKFFSNVL